MIINFTNESNVITTTKDFVFISYSHNDSKTVFQDLDVIDSLNMNYWVDKELLAGDKWDETVYDVIVNEHCKGAILFLSPDYLLSEAACKEVEICFEKKKKNGDFTIVIISCNNRSVLGNISEVFGRLQGYNDKQLQQVFPQERLCTMVSRLEKNILYLPPLFTCAEDNISQFTEVFRAKVPSVFDDSKYYYKVLTEKMNIRNVDGVNELEFGFCPTSRADNGGYFLCDGFAYIDGKHLYKRKEQVYLAEKIRWKVIDINDNEMLMVSDRALFFAQESSLPQMLQEGGCLQIEEEYRDCVKEISLFELEDEETAKKLLGNSLIYTQFAKDSKTKPFPDVFLFGEDKKCAYNTAVKKLQAPVNKMSFGFIYPCLKIDTKKLLSTEV